MGVWGLVQVAGVVEASGVNSAVYLGYRNLSPAVSLCWITMALLTLPTTQLTGSEIGRGMEQGKGVLENRLRERVRVHPLESERPKWANGTFVFLEPNLVEHAEDR